PDHLPTYGDRDLIQQAVVNLVDNAVKFSPPGSAVRLSAKSIAVGVEILVADQGPGIPEAERERGTERFFRGETARNTPGSGVGLALVQAVAQLHGGSLRLVDNAPGATSILTLAGHEDAAGHAQRQCHATTTGGRVRLGQDADHAFVRARRR